MLRLQWLAPLFSFALLASPLASVSAHAQVRVRDAGPPHASKSELPALTSKESLPLEARAIPLPQFFEPSYAGGASEVQFVLRSPSFSAALRADGFRVSSFHPRSAAPAQALITWIGASEDVSPVAEGHAAHRAVYWNLAPEDTRLLADLPTYRRVRYSELYPGIDLVYHTSANTLEFDFEIEPGRDPGQVQFQVNGPRSVVITPEGDLHFDGRVPLAKIRRPVAYQTIAGERVPVEARFNSVGGNAFGFALGEYDKSQRLVIDPIVERTFLFGGDGPAAITDLLHDAQGNVYLVGDTNSPLPGDPSPREPVAGVVGQSYWMFVTKLTPDLSEVEFTAYVAVQRRRYDFGLDISSDGDIVFASDLQKANEGTAVTVGPYGGGGLGIFVARVTGNGRMLRYSTILRSMELCDWRGIDSDADGNTFILAHMTGASFPFVAGSYGEGGPSFANDENFLFKLSPAGTLLYTARMLELGSMSVSMSVDSAGRPVFYGATGSNIFPPTPGTVSAAFEGEMQGFVLRLNKAGTRRELAAYFGGNRRDSIEDLFFDSRANVFIHLRGNSTSSYPTTANAFLKSPLVREGLTITQDALLKLSPDMTELLYGSYFRLDDEIPTTSGSFLPDDADRVYYVADYSRIPGTDGSLLPYISELGRLYLSRLSTDGMYLDYRTFLPVGFRDTKLHMLPGQRLLMADWGSWLKQEGDLLLATTDKDGIRSPGQDPRMGYNWFGVVALASPQLCHVVATPSPATHPWPGGSGTIEISAGPGCPWHAAYPPVDHLASLPDTIRLAPRNGIGNGTIHYELVPESYYTYTRSHTIRIGDKDVVLTRLGKPEQVGVETTPPGATVLVNGSPRVTPFQFVVGPDGPVTLEAQAVSNVSAFERLRFVRWDTTLERKLTITWPYGGWRLAATFNREFRPSVSIQGQGSVSFLSAWGSDFYPVGEMLTVQAIPAAGYRFSHWSGDANDTRNPLVARMDRARSVTATFVPVASSGPALITSGPLDELRGGSQPALTNIAIQLQSTGAPIPLGEPQIRCPSGANIITAALASDVTPAFLSVNLNEVAAASLPNQRISCTVSVSRGDGGRPDPIEFNVVAELHYAADPLMMAMPNTASYLSEGLAPGGIFSLFGVGLADGTENAETLPLPFWLQGTKLMLATEAKEWELPLFFVSPLQVNFFVPTEVPLGLAHVRLLRGGRDVATFWSTVYAVSPGLFTANANGRGVPAGYTVRVKGERQVRGEISTCPGDPGSCVPVPVDWGENDEEVFLILFGTGYRNSPDYRPELLIGGDSVAAEYVGPQGHFVGLDQLNFKLPSNLRGRGLTNFRVRYRGAVVALDYQLHF